jgi:hypothetical protein
MAQRTKSKSRLSPFYMVHQFVCGGAIEFGKAVILDVADGDAVEADGTTGVSIGRSCGDYADGDLGTFEQGIFNWDQGGGTTITKAHRGAVVYWDDDQSVTLTRADGKEAGTVYDVDAFGIWVLTHIDQHLASVANALVAPASMAAGDMLYATGVGNTIDNLAIGTATQILGVNAGATAPEWEADD